MFSSLSSAARFFLVFIGMKSKVASSVDPVDDSVSSAYVYPEETSKQGSRYYKAHQTTQI